MRIVFSAAIAASIFAAVFLTISTVSAAEEGVVRTYYIAADPVEWDYAPQNRNVFMDKEFDEVEANWVTPTDHRAGKVFKKALYRAYTDDSFTTLKSRSADWEHLGNLGPLIRAEVGDTIKVVFRNNAHFPASVHPHGVFYDKDSEGALYNDETSGDDKKDDAVPTGGTHVYTWGVPERAGPAPGGDSSAFWMYHSHTNEEYDVNAGLMGAMIVTAKGQAGEGLRPNDVDREFVVAFMSTEEQHSWYFRENLDSYAGKPEELEIQYNPFGTARAVAPDGSQYRPFVENMNGYIYANGPTMTARKGERVRWYVMAGTGFEVHAPHWHGNVVTEGTMRTDVLELTTMGMHIANMVPDDAGKWFFHCHVTDHFRGGMAAIYEVLEE